MASAVPTAVDVDVAHESSARVVWALAWPAVLLNSLQVVNSILDRAFIGRQEEAALAALGASMNILFLMISLAMTLATSATALVSRSFGAGDAAQYRTACAQCLRVAIIAGVVLAALTFVVTPTTAYHLTKDHDRHTIALMTAYLTAFAAGMPAFFIIQTLAGSLRGIGDTKSPMMISGLQIVLHIVLNYILIFPPKHIAGGIVIPGFGMGLMGAGVALSMSAWISALVYLLYMSKTPLGRLGNISLPAWNWTVRILRIASPAALMALLRVFSLTVLTLIIVGLDNGAVAMGAMGAAFAIEGIMFMPAFGFSVSASALVGQSLGMRRPDRAERLGWMSGHMSALLVVLLVVPIYVFAPSIGAAMIEGKAQIASEAIVLLRYMCVTEVLFAYAMVMIGALQGAGDTVRPMWISIIALWGLRVPMAFVCAGPLRMGSSGVWLAITVSQAVQGLLAMAAFKHGAWKQKEV